MKVLIAKALSFVSITLLYMSVTAKTAFASVNPTTGDNFNILLLAGIAAGSLAVIVAVLVLTKKKK